MNKPSHTYPNGIHRIRKKRGLTLQALEKLTGIPNEQISRAERHGTGLGDERWNKLALALGVKSWELHVPVEIQELDTEKNLQET